jgi:hypothetical protein
MKTRTMLVAIAGAALALAAPGASAQTKPKKPAPVTAPVAAPAPAPSSSGIGAGDTEMNFFGQFTDHDTLGTIMTFGLGYGTYVSDDMQLKLTQVLVIADADAASIFSYSPYVSAEYQIRQAGSPFVLYVGGGAGLNLTSIDAGGFDAFTYSLFLTPVAGAKYFLDERMSLTYSLSYQFPLIGETCTDIDCFDSDTTTLQNFLGFSIYY